MKRNRLSKKPPRNSQECGTGSQEKRPSAGSILNFFAAKEKREEKKVNCPICEKEVLYKTINTHLDTCKQAPSSNSSNNSQELKNGSENVFELKNVKVNTNMKGLDDMSDNKNDTSINTNNKRKIEEVATDERSDAKKVRKLDEDDISLSDNDFGDDDLLNFFTQSSQSKTEFTNTNDKCNSDATKTINLDKVQMIETFKSPDKFTNSPTQERIILSPSLSYNLARYGGEKALSQTSTQFVRTSSKTAAEKYGKRKSSHIKLPDLPQHDPYTPRKRQDPSYIPYYVTNFEYTINCVIDCTDDWELFNQDELDMIETYRNLPLSAKKLYVRLFNRKHAWILESGMKYDECPDVAAAAQILVSANLFQSRDDLEDIEECLNILLSPEIKIIAKEFNIPASISTKHDIIQEIKKLCQKKSFFQTKITLKDKVLKRGRSLVGACYRLHPTSRSVLNRVLCLWGVSQWWGERENDRPPSSLTTLLLANQGKLLFPQYFIIREKKIFRNREDLLACESAMKLVDKLETCLMNKDFDAGYLIYQDLKSQYKSLIADTQVINYVKGLPVFLRRLTTASMIAYGLSKSVDLLEKMKDYVTAVELLKLLLDTDFIYRYRGVWYERLCLDLESHLKEPVLCLQYIETALQDSRVRGARRLALHQRVTKICKSKRNSLEDNFSRFTERSDWEDPSSDDLPTVVISGKMVSKEGVTSTKSVFILTKNGETTYCNVEELVRDHYKDCGLVEGCHAEGAVLNSLLGLLFWDIIYLTQVPDAYRDAAQSTPLDWDTDDFYASRKDIIHQRLEQLSSMSRDELVGEIEDYYNNNLNVSSIVNWDIFRDVDHLIGLVRCFDPSQLTKIMERMIRDHRTYRSGLPDLTCWNPVSQEVRFVEVKGPGDKLSYKQILWIRFFISIGVTSEVCHVDPTGSFTAVKKVLPSKSKPTPKKNKSEVKKKIQETVKNQKLQETKLKKKSNKNRCRAKLDFDADDDFNI